MESPGAANKPPGKIAAIRRLRSLLLALFVFSAFHARAELQFDVFPGYDNVVPEDGWFPIVCEIKNDSLTFNGTIEISSGQFNDNQTRRMTVELPTGTLKRVVIPAFSTARYQSSWSARLLDEHGHVRAETPTIQSKQVAPGIVVMGAIPRTATGVPVLRRLQQSQSDPTMQPVAARMLTSLLPDNPLVLEGMRTIYLNSEKATELNDNQVRALLAWLNLGGHLIVGIEQISDVNAVGWLRSLIPCNLTDMRTIPEHAEIQTWLQSPLSAVSALLPSKNHRPVKNAGSQFDPYTDLTLDSEFERAEMQVATGTLRGGAALISSGDTPLVITSIQGRGQVTALMFSPERKPFSTWKNAPSFWARLAGVDPNLYAPQSGNNMVNGGWSIDGVFGAMIDSRQVRKLPVEWLLLLLIAYLVVIGPLDQYWLKRIRRPMLTWITFPAYVVLFSLLIYFIGYKLRAGETEWNELHVVDVLPRGDGAELRGRTYASIYSPVNATYHVENRQEFSTFRGEFQSTFMGGGQDTERVEILQTGDNFKADIYVPVWTSQLYVSDWWQAAELPIKLAVTAGDFNWTVTVDNLRDHPLAGMRLAVAGRMLELGTLAAHQAKTYTLRKDQGMTLNDYVSSHGNDFQNAASQRQQAFGQSGGINDTTNSAMGISFISKLPGERFVTPPGLDLSPLLEQGEAILLAWESDYAPIKPLNQFPTRRSRHDTLWRMAVPVQVTPAP